MNLRPQPPARDRAEPPDRTTRPSRMGPTRTAAALAVGLGLALAGAAGCGTDTEPAPSAAAATESTAETAPAAPTAPTALECPGNTVMGTFDFFNESGEGSAEEAAAPLVPPGTTTVVDRTGPDRAVVWVLRPDGTARIRLDVLRNPAGWRPETHAYCEGEGWFSASARR